MLKKPMFRSPQRQADEGRRLLGDGAAGQTAKVVTDTNARKKSRLDEIMGGIRQGRGQK